jgi:hypothetical protein
MKSCLRITWAGLVVLAGLALAGCARTKAPVSGSVKYKGKALPSGVVSFVSSDNQVASGQIGADGSYSIPAVTVGPAKVSVQVATPGKRSMMMGPPGGEKKMTSAGPKDMAERSAITTGEGAGTPVAVVQIPLEYANPDTSGLTFTVQPGANTFNIDLK